MKLKFDDLEMAMEFSSMDSFGEHTAYLCKESGQIYYDSDASEEELPDDIYENERYIEIPTKRDLGLGKPLVLQFVEEFLPADFRTVQSIFSSSGAYSRYKALLEDRTMLDNWYEYEQDAQKKELLDWCKFNGIEVDI